MLPDSTNGKTKYGIILLNMGGPEDLDAVQPFLYNLFSDSWIINLPFPIKYFQKPLAWMISKFRSNTTKEMYSLIGGKSESNQITVDLANKIQENLIDMGINNVSLTTMRYSAPRAKETITLLEEAKVDELVLFTQYPHYAKSTTGSSYHEFIESLENSPLVNSISLKIMDWGDENEYLNWWIDGISNLIADRELIQNKDLHIVFTCHGLPLKYIKKGEIYPERIELAVDKIKEGLGDIAKQSSVHLCYQSRAGPFAWLQPYTDKKIKEIADSQPEAIIMVPLGFVSNNVETLYEIDILYRDLAESLGITNYYRVNTPDADPDYAKSMANLLQRKIREN